MLKGKWSIRLVIPCLLIVFCLVQWLYYYNATTRDITLHIEETNLQHVTQIMHRGQTRLELYQQYGHTETVRKYVADFAADTNIVAVFLLAEDGKVQASLNNNEIGRDYNGLVNEKRYEFLKPMNKFMNEARSSLRGYVNLDQDRCHIVGMFPVLYQSSPEIKRPDRRGMFVFVRNLVPQKQAVFQMLHRQFFIVALIMLVVVGATIYFLHIFVGRKVNRLLDATKSFADGNYTARYGESSHDELGMLGKAFDDMAERVELSLVQIVKRDEDLRKKTGELNRYFDSSLDLLCVADTDGYFRHLNHEWERTLGYSINELEGRSFLNLVHPDDLAATREAVSKLSNRQNVINFVNRYRCKDGSYRWLEWRSYPDGKNIYAVARDITARKEAETALRESELRLKSVLDSIDIGVVLIDAESHRIVDINPAATTMIGAPKEQIVGKLCHQFICPAEKGKCPITDLGRNIDKSECVLLTAGNNSIPVLKTVTSISLGGRKILVESCVDISERLSLEEQLRQKQKMEAIGQLAGGIAHDYNNQLTPIMGFAEMLIERLDDPKLRVFAQNILRAATRSKDLTQQLLDFSRKGKFLHKPMNVHQIIGDVVSILEHSIDKRIQIKQRLEANPPTIMGDPTQIQNAILNLALNARDAMPNGGELVFHTQVEDIRERVCPVCTGAMASGKYLRVNIADTGYGISEGVRTHLFEPFFTTKKVGEGTGLGLASVFGTVRSHQGHVSFESVPGKGTTFTLYLPLIPAEKEVPPPPTSMTKTNANIFLVEDEEQIVGLILAMAEKIGCNVVSRSNGREALEYYRQNWKDIDLVILDMMMPVMGGKETFREMKKINPKIKAILSSGYSLTSEAGEMIEEGILDFIQKPFVSAELSEKIHKALSA